MTIERIPLDDDRDAWLASRRRYVNASEMAIVCGVASYGSLAELYADKKGLRPPLVNSGVLRRGRWGEPAVFEALSETYPEWKIKRARVHCIDRERRIAATPDGFAEAPDRRGLGLVEAKVVASSVFRSKWLDNPDDDLANGAATPPANFRIQTTTTRMLNDDVCEWAAIAVVINSEFDWKFRLFEIDRDPVLESRILYCASEFHKNYLDPGIMPPFEPQRDEQLVKLLYPNDDGTEIDLRGDNRALAATDELVETSAAIKRMELQEKSLKTELSAKLGSHTYGRLADGRILTLKTQHRKAYSAAATSFRVLRVAKAKEAAE